MKKRLSLLAMVYVAGFMVTGCAHMSKLQKIGEGRVKYISATDVVYPEKTEEECKRLKIVSFRPDLENYEELGDMLVEFYLNIFTGIPGPATRGEAFIKLAKAHACHLGADLIVKETNGVGDYTRAVLFRRIN